MSIPTTRAEAKATGAKHYFTGKPCKHGHIALRETKGACVECRKLEHEASYANRKEYFAEYNKSEKGAANKKAYYEKNKEVVIARAMARPAEAKRRYTKVWEEKYPEKKRAIVNARRRRYKAATPHWLTPEQKAEIRGFYLEAQKLIKETGQRFEVDHIEPIQGEDVCGLNVPWNLQILLKEANLKKSNKRVDTSNSARHNSILLRRL
jgi:hypothetical protein